MVAVIVLPLVSGEGTITKTQNLVSVFSTDWKIDVKGDFSTGMMSFLHI
jgi:hypothetical protein